MIHELFLKSTPAVSGSPLEDSRTLDCQEGAPAPSPFLPSPHRADDSRDDSFILGGAT
jgi:hypothetical protein